VPTSPALPLATVGLCGALVLHGRYKTVAAPRHRDQIALSVADRAQHLAQRGHVDLKVVLFYDDAGPELRP